ncbi:DUF1360 domain-containing protein [Halobacillus litoralis]|uniref:Sporulation protein n=1 Tax=Halobacillus litoralis TaxID=45668 RepID=A0A410MA96_9BACI|nr:DUF1360 domain-containing protein [Halobacillus litoralis]QAS51598.1 hypothetical protein HLI_04830 [Halobacillus litoralis]
MLNIFEFLLLGLASFRLTRLIVRDYIMEWLRRPFIEVRIEKNEDGIEEEWIEPKGFIGEGLGCQWCVGVWSSLIMVFFYIMVPYGEWLVFILALAALQSIIYSWSNLLE